MKAENLFKFVAMRVARPAESRASSTVPMRNTDDEFLALIARRTGSAVPLDRARREVAREIMDSPDYWMRNADWRPLVPLEPVLRRLLHEAHDPDEIRDLVDQLFRARLGQDFALEQFVGGTTFARMKQALWRSYYSNLLLPERRGQDRSSLLFWMRLFHWLENAEDSGLRGTLLAQFDRLRPTVPGALLLVDEEKVKPEEPDAEDDDPESARTKRIAAARQRIQSLVAARAKVRQAFETRLIAFEANPPKSPSPRGSDESVTDAAPPWKLAAAELDYDTNATLEAQGISLALHDATRIGSLLDQKIARERSALHELERVADITFVKGVPVRVRRRIGEMA